MRGRTTDEATHKAGLFELTLNRMFFLKSNQIPGPTSESAELISLSIRHNVVFILAMSSAEERNISGLRRPLMFIP